MDTRTKRTVAGMHLNNYKALGLPYKPQPNTTINQKFDVANDIQLRPGEYPVIGYLAIGCAGATFSTRSNNRPLTTQLPHSPEDNGMFEYIPFCARRLDDDLTPEEREKYRMRVVANNDAGEPYVFYYLLKMKTDTVLPAVHIRTVVDGKTSTKTYEPTVETLTPIPRPPSNIENNNPKNDCFIATAPIEVILGPQDIAELLNVFTILDGDPYSAYITEIGVVTGVDRKVTSPGTGMSGSYTEVICAELNAYLFDVKHLNETSTRIHWTIDVGSSEPIL